MSDTKSPPKLRSAQLQSILQVPAFLAARTEEFGDCLLWTRCYVGASPKAWVTLADGSSQTRPVRRALWLVLYGAVPPDKDVTTRCGSHKCVEPRHMRLTDRKTTCQSASAQGRLHSPTRSASMRKAMEQRKDRLGESGAAQVRALLAQGLSQAAVATTMGVTVEAVRAIATNRSYPVSQTWRSMVDTLLAFPETTR